MKAGIPGTDRLDDIATPPDIIMATLSVEKSRLALNGFPTVPAIFVLS